MTEAAERENKALYKGVALVLSSYLHGINTQLHGDIPYSEAAKEKTEGNFTSRFDENEEVFKGIINDLEVANELLSSGKDDINTLIHKTLDTEIFIPVEKSRLYVRLVGNADDPLLLKNYMYCRIQFIT